MPSAAERGTAPGAPLVLARGMPEVGQNKAPREGGVGSALGPPHSSDDLTAVHARLAASAAASHSEPASPWPTRKRQQSFFDGSPSMAKRARAAASSPCLPLETLLEEGADCTSGAPPAPESYIRLLGDPGVPGWPSQWRGPSEQMAVQEGAPGGLSGAELSDANNAAPVVGSTSQSGPELQPAARAAPGYAKSSSGLLAEALQADQLLAHLCGSDRRAAVKAEGMELDTVWDDLDLCSMELPEHKGGGLLGGATMGVGGAAYNDTPHGDAIHNDTVSATKEPPSLTVQEAQSPYRGNAPAPAWGSLLAAHDDLWPLRGEDQKRECTHLLSSVDGSLMHMGPYRGNAVFNVEASGLLEDVVQGVGASLSFNCTGDQDDATHG